MRSLEKLSFVLLTRKTDKKEKAVSEDSVVPLGIGQFKQSFKSYLS